MNNNLSLFSIYNQQNLFFFYIKEILLRIVYIIIYFFIILFVSIIYYKEIYIFLTFPIFFIKGNIFYGFISTNLIEIFFINIYLAFFFSLFLTYPYIILQIWFFFKPGFTYYEQWHLFRILKIYLFLYLFSIFLGLYILIPGSWFFFIYEDLSLIYIQPRIDYFFFYLLKVIFFSFILFNTPILFFYGVFFHILNLKFFLIYPEKIIFNLIIFLMLFSLVDFFISLISLIFIYFFYEIIILFYIFDKKYQNLLNLK